VSIKISEKNFQLYAALRALGEALHLPVKPIEGRLPFNNTIPADGELPIILQFAAEGVT